MSPILQEFSPRSSRQDPELLRASKEGRASLLPEQVGIEYRGCTGIMEDEMETTI